MSNTRLIAILGATGTQGGSVVDTFLADPSWKIRALTRNVSSAKAQALASRSSMLEVVTADANDASSLLAAFQGADVIFSVTDFWTLYFDPSSKGKLKPGQALQDWCFETEVQHGRNIIDAASQVPTLKRLIFSSLANVTKWSGGRYKHVPHFDSKAIAADYGQKQHPELWSKTSIIQVGMYLTNFLGAPWLKPHTSNDGTYIFNCPTPLKEPIPFVAAEKDTGSVIKALVELPPGKNVIAYRELMTFLDYINLWGDILGLPTAVNYGPLDAPDDLWKELEETWQWAGEFGYWAHDDKSVVHPKDLGISLELGTVEDWIKAQDWKSIVQQ